MSYDFIIWGQPQCVYCEMAKKLIESKGKTYLYKELGNGYTKQDLLQEVPSARSVPQVLTSQLELIGGYNELKMLLK